MPFQSGRTGVVSSFTYNDIAEGRSTKLYFAGTVSGANVISPNTFFSNEISTSGATTTSMSKILDMDFDIDFNRPRLIEGKSIVNITLTRALSLGSLGIGVSTTIILKKWDGTTETEIVREDSTVFPRTVDNISAEVRGDIVAVKFDIPRTKFKAGETLRMTIEIWGWSTDVTNTPVIGFAHDPKNRQSTDDTALSSVMTFEVPFVVDI